MSLDPAKLDEFMGKAVGDLGSAFGAALVRIGDRLGLYKALAEAPATPGELAGRTATHERYVREWLANQAAGGYVTFDAASGKYSLTAEQAFALAEEGSPAFLPGAFDVVAAAFKAQDRLTEAFRTGAGLGWHEQDPCLFAGTERFFRPAYAANLVSSWLPALDGVIPKLERGASVADVGCGHGASTILMAKAFPASRFRGFDYHAASIDTARRRAAEAGVADRVSFDVSRAAQFPGEGYDLVTFFDCLHDMGDPEGAARRVKQALKPDGTWMLVEPMAGDHVADNLNPVGRLFYGASTMICVPASIAQEGPALGAQAGQRKLEDVVRTGGFTRVRRATETPFNMVLEARP